MFWQHLLHAIARPLFACFRNKYRQAFWKQFLFFLFASFYMNIVGLHYYWFRLCYSNYVNKHVCFLHKTMCLNWKISWNTNRWGFEHLTYNHYWAYFKFLTFQWFTQVGNNAAIKLLLVVWMFIMKFWIKIVIIDHIH